MLIWNDPLSSPIVSIKAEHSPASVSLLAYEALTTWRTRCPGAPQAPPLARSPGRRVRHVVLRRVGGKADLDQARLSGGNDFECAEE